MHKKHIFLRVFSKITIFACVFYAFFASSMVFALPAGYTELEYIESTGRPWIDTGIAPTSTMIFDIGYLYPSVASSSMGNVLFGSRSSQSAFMLSNFRGDASAFINPTETRNGYCRIGAVNSTGTIALPQLANVVNTLRCDTDGYVYLNGNKVYNMPLTRSEMPSKTITLFKANIQGSRVVEDPCDSGTRIYYFKLVDNGITVRNFIPAKRNSDNEIGMYDTVSGTFFTNQGTGDFIAGPVVEIKIATTKMVDEEFAAAEAKLATTVQTIESVVSRTISQTEQIQILQDTKQTRPDETCPANMKCLLVQDEDGTPHWYPIIEP